ncbi:MAG: FHA domain-containing protein FhaB/FipA [Acidimicrobiales bacterium]
MSESLLTILKLCFLALLYLFMLRVVRAVWVELKPPRVATPVPVAEPRGGAPVAAPRERRRKSEPRLTVLEPPGTAGQSFELGDELTMGRAAGCQITLEDTYVSQLHARVFRRDGQIWVEDLGSTNGTYLNRRKVTAPVAIRRGDRLQLGQTLLELSR